MPLVKIEILKGQSNEYKKKLMNSIHRSLVEALKIKEEDNYQRLYELEKENFQIAPGKTNQFTLIEIIMFRGRSFEAKKKLYEVIARNLMKEPGIQGDDIMILLQDPPLEHWGLRGGKPANEINFDFKINV